MNTAIAPITFLTFLAAQVSPVAAQSLGTSSARPAVARAAQSAAARPIDGGWPRTYTTRTGARVVIYQPQVASWVDQKRMTLYAAVSYQPAGAAQPSLGTMGAEADTRVALNERLVNFSEFTVTQSNFPTIPRESVREVVAEIVDAMPKEQRVIALDRVLASVDASQILPKNANGVRSDPPRIFVSQTPALLVNLDGDPIWSPIAKNDLKYAVNTNWDLFQYPVSNTFYLRVDKSWLTATVVDGPWRRAAAALPASFASLPDDGNWADVKAAVPGTAFPAGQMPVVFVSRSPAELILIAGAPVYVPVKDTHLEWVSNTESDLFRMGKDGALYFLTSGRWFSAPDFAGPWTFVTPNLPDDFARIPIDHPRSRVLASVPGTRQAQEAVLLAQVPQTARVNRRDVVAPTVSYQGEPRFEQIEQTSVVRAVNTDKDILKVGDIYYLCYQGVWFKGDSPTGPWQVADSVPTEIYQIPVSSPAYNVKYVTVEGSDEDWVDFAAAGAYDGMMVAWGCAMWGSGYYYPPYIGWDGYYPAYFPYYPSYGYGAHYNPWTGTFSRGGAVYGPNGGAGYTARYNPSTGTYARGAAAWGPNSARGAAAAFNPRTGTAAAAARGRNAYGSWSSAAVQRGDQWAQSSRVTRNATGTTTRVTQGSGGGGAVTRRGPENRGFAGKTAAGDVYAGRDGSVYRNQNGSWQKYEGGGWNNVQRPGTGDRPTGTSGQLGSAARERSTTTMPGTLDQLKQDRGARIEGKQRTSDLGRSQFGGGSSYRPSGGFSGGMRGFGGGGMRGGGRRR